MDKDRPMPEHGDTFKAGVERGRSMERDRIEMWIRDEHDRAVRSGMSLGVKAILAELIDGLVENDYPKDLPNSG